jgi:hypothetical protein
MSWIMCRGLVCISGMVIASGLNAETADSRLLPQAQPGSNYAAQLAIPPGLGYPFAECRLTGDQLPSWLALDCLHLQLRGRVPAGMEKTYRITLFVSDHGGNSRSFAMTLPVSSKPVFVDLGEPAVTATSQARAESVGRDTGESMHESDAKAVPKVIVPVAVTNSAGNSATYAATSAEANGVAPGLIRQDATTPGIEIASLAEPAALPAATENGAKLKVPAKTEKDTAANPSSPSTKLKPNQILLGNLDAGASSVLVAGEDGATVRLFDMTGVEDENPDAPTDDGHKCENAVDKGRPILLKTSETDATPITSLTTGSSPQTVYLLHPLLAGARLCAEVSKDQSDSYSSIVEVQDSLNWGRVRAYFVGGVLVSNTQSNFSSSAANEFLALNMDKFWILPGCNELDMEGKCPTKNPNHWPGLSTYFETRLTAIPVSSTTTTQTAASAAPAGAFARWNVARPRPLATAPADGATDTTLSSQKTARVQVGMYAPWVFTHWGYNHADNALYVAPIAKVGFDTLTGSTTPTSVTPTGGGSAAVTQANLERVYNFYTFGGRVGHFGLNHGRDRSPELQSYLDFTFGPYSNLTSYVCEATAKAGLTKENPTTDDNGVATNADGSSCGIGVESLFPYPSQKRIWRFDIEGLLKIPSTPLVIGLNANIGQRSVGSDHLDANRAPGDDVRFLFGTKVDLSQVLKKLSVPSF